MIARGKPMEEGIVLLANDGVLQLVTILVGRIMGTNTFK